MMFRLANWAMARNTVRLVAALNVSESGSLTPAGSSSPGGAARRALDQRLELGPAAARIDGYLGAQLLPGVAQRGVDLRVGRIELGRELELDDRLFVALGRRQPAAADGVLLRRRAS